MKKRHISLLLVFLLVGILLSGCNTSPAAEQAKNGNTVLVNYTGKLADGTVFDSSVGFAPLEFTLDGSKVIPGFEKAVLGMKVGQKKTVTIPANEAYGPYRNELTLEIPRTDLLARNIVPQVGMKLQSTQQDGSLIIVTITKMTETTVTLDANHPLAGKDLTFEIELLKILR